jgi:hypothetical protein
MSFGGVPYQCVSIKRAIHPQLQDQEFEKSVVGEEGCILQPSKPVWCTVGWKVCHDEAKAQDLDQEMIFENLIVLLAKSSEV